MAKHLCACGIDVHAHIVPENFPKYLHGPEPAHWPSMAPAHECHRSVMLSGKIYRTVSDKSWDAPKRLADMADMGLSLQAVSPMPELFSYWMDAEPASELLRYINDQIAVMMAHTPGKIAGLAAVPLQDLDLAVAEMHRVMAMGFAGVELGSNINGQPIGAPEFEPFLAEAARIGAAVFVHAVRPAGMDRLVGPAPLQQVLAYPGEIGLAAASVITSNLMLRHPTLRIAFSHGGGTLGLLLPRLIEGVATFPALAKSIEAPPAEQARLLYFDTLVYDAPTLRHLLDLFGDTRLMLGTDYPFNFHERDPIGRVEAAFTDPAIRQRLVCDNASDFLGLSKGTA